MSRSDSPEYLTGLLHELCSVVGETEWVEFKRNNADPQEIGEYISALSNAAALCGKVNAYVVWGVDDDTRGIVGTTFRPSRAKKGAEDLENWLTRLLNPSPHFRFVEFDYEGMLVSLLEIPRAWHRPVQFQGQEYIRVGSYKKKLKAHPEKERELWRIFDTVPFEQQVAAERQSGTDVLALLDYPAYFGLLDIPLPENREQILARLADDHLIAPREQGCWDILNLGAILFAKDLGRFQHLQRKSVRVIEYEGEGRVRTKREYQGHMGYAAGFEGLIGFLKPLLPENEVIGEALRKTVPMYPELAIRELVANAIIHQDFTMTGTGPMIELFSNRLEITNPGEPLMDTRRFVDTPPQSRNEALASFLRRVGICEERGSGVDKVVFETEFFQLPAPLFEVVGGHTRAVLFAHKPFREMDKAERVRACYLHACLQYVQRSQMTNTTLRGRFGVNERNRAQVSRVISDTMDASLIKPYDPESDSKRHASYVPYWA
jgi:predicted HTH transcriptional regulator